MGSGTDDAARKHGVEPCREWVFDQGLWDRVNIIVPEAVPVCPHSARSRR